MNVNNDLLVPVSMNEDSGQLELLLQHVRRDQPIAVTGNNDLLLGDFSKSANNDLWLYLEAILANADNDRLPTSRT